MRSALLALACAAGLVCVSGCGSNTAKSTGSTLQPDAAAEAARAKAREEAEAAREAERLAALWNYYEAPVDKGLQLSASIFSTNGVDADGLGARSVRLVFRDHPEWGRSSYLVLQSGDFQCYGGCRVAVTIDDEAPKRMTAKRPKTDEAIAMFINDAPVLWRSIGSAKRLSVEFPVRAGGTRTASFEVSGLDRSKMPGWDKPASTKTGARFPSIWQPSTELRGLRALLLHRHEWVRMRTRVRNALQSVALAHGIRRHASLWSRNGQTVLCAFHTSPGNPVS